MKKLICCFLALLTLVSAVACGSAGQETAETTQPAAQTTLAADEQTEAPDPLTVPEFEEVKYTGETFTIADSMTKETKYSTNSFIVHEECGEPLEDAIFERTIKLEETFGITLEDIAVDNTAFCNSAAAGDNLYDMHNATLSNVMGVVNKGIIADLATLENIHLEKLWWDQQAQQKLSFKGRVYYTFCDFTITGFDNARATFFNKDMLDELNVPKYSTADMYRISEEGTWTWDIMAELAKAAVSDLDGNGVIDAKDRQGITDSSTTFYETLLTGCNGEMLKQGPDGVPYFFCFDEQDQFITIYQTLLSTFSSDNRFIPSDSNVEPPFTEGRALFYISTLSAAVRMRGSEANFGILPCPKWNADQENYMNVSPNGHALMIPTNVENMDRTSNLFEAMAYFSSRYAADDAVMPTYFEIAITAKSSNDWDSAKNLQIIHDNIAYTIKIISQTPCDIYSHFKNKNLNISSIVTASAKAQKKKLASVLEELG